MAGQTTPKQAPGAATRTKDIDDDLVSTKYLRANSWGSGESTFSFPPSYPGAVVPACNPDQLDASEDGSLCDDGDKEILDLNCGDWVFPTDKGAIITGAATSTVPSATNGTNNKMPFKFDDRAMVDVNSSPEDNDLSDDERTPPLILPVPGVDNDEPQPRTTKLKKVVERVRGIPGAVVSGSSSMMKAVADGDTVRNQIGEYLVKPTVGAGTSAIATAKGLSGSIGRQAGLMGELLKEGWASLPPGRLLKHEKQREDGLTPKPPPIAPIAYAMAEKEFDAYERTQAPAGDFRRGHAFTLPGLAGIGIRTAKLSETVHNILRTGRGYVTSVQRFLDATASLFGDELQDNIREKFGAFETLCGIVLSDTRGMPYS
ncbi:hypothetical protein B0T10DRAFT_582106 [Thelonectria olida]|uniref:Uncharacterized protein n=1 Tax=Thelonectria olida TaxID=1576542 RepID=A0A9P9AHF1_9HYPO|nr:hypothetical protein B0T10DRAFT_582106 [Thelonectria olida]